MNEVIVFDDAEALLVSYLKSVQPEKVATRRPKDATGKFIRVVRIGGSKIRLNADAPTLVFECWADSEVDSSDLCKTVRGYVNALAGSDWNGTWIYKVKEVGVSHLDDPVTGIPRYQFTATIDMRGQAI